MCISGTTSTSTSGATAFGAGLGLVLNQPVHGVTVKPPYNTTAPPKGGPPIVGFAVTLSGDSGGSALNINIPQPLTGTGEAPAVTVPAISAANSPVTYNILINDAIISDNATAPVPHINAANINSVEVAIPGADGMAHAYNFCITKIVPLTAAPAAPGALASYGAQFNEGKQIVVEALNGYGVQNDPFGLGAAASMPMTVSYGGGKVGFTASPQFNTVGSNTPGAFPSVISGWVHGGNIIGANEGGYAGTTTITAMTSAVSSWTFTTPSGGSWDAAYDVWLAQNAAPINAGFELMVWVDKSTVNPLRVQRPGPSVSIGGSPYTIVHGHQRDGAARHLVSERHRERRFDELDELRPEAVLHRRCDAGHHHRKRHRSERAGRVPGVSARYAVHDIVLRDRDPLSAEAESALDPDADDNDGRPSRVGSNT